MTKYNEQNIETYSKKGTRINLLKVTNKDQKVKYQVRLNRRVKYTNTFEWEARKHFAIYVQNSILQLKIY